MLVTFGALALRLSMVGLYAALAFAVGERTREIAVRLALGASRADVGGLVFRRGMAIVLLGIGAGVAACVIVGPFLAHLLYGVSPRDPLAITAGPAVLIVVAGWRSRCRPGAPCNRVRSSLCGRSDERRDNLARDFVGGAGDSRVRAVDAWCR